MRKFTKPFRGVVEGDIYPTDFEVGDNCPPELEAGAESLGALGPAKAEKVEKPAKAEKAQA